MFVYSLTTFLLSLSDILYVTYLASNEIYISCKNHSDTENSRRCCAKIEFDSTIFELCGQRGLFHFEIKPTFSVLFS